MSGQVQVQGVPWNGVKVFSATTYSARENLGDVITKWIAANPTKTIVETQTLQSSDAEFHCLTIVVLYREGKQ